MATLYVADKLSHPPPPNPPIGFGNIYRVTSAPSNELGSDGDEAHDTITGDDWQKVNGVWVLAVPGGTGGSGTYSGNGSPEGVITAPVGSIYTDLDGTHADWRKITGSGNTGWQLKAE